MSGRRLFYCFILAGFSLLLVGCGGAQNPMTIGPQVPAFIDGWWDGITIFFAGLIEMLSDKEYGIYDVRQKSDAYDFGYFVGVGMFFWAVYTAFSIIRN